MSIPNLKRVRVASVGALGVWLANAPNTPQHLMLVTFTDACGDKHVSPVQVDDTLAEFGWDRGRRYTLGANQIGHVISRS